MGTTFPTLGSTLYDYPLYASEVSFIHKKPVSQYYLPTISDSVKMIFEQLLDISPITLSILLPVSVLVYCLLQYLLDPLRSLPGPFLAQFSRFWYFFELYKGSFEETNIELHKRYGPIVRIAPYEYSVDDVDAARTIYGHGNAFIKVIVALSLCS
jgi:hypothetical protein